MNDYRKMCKYIISHDGGCPAVREGFPSCDPESCRVGAGDCLPDDLKERAILWLADHPDTPAKTEPIHKGASRGESTYSLSLSDGRITLYHWHGKDSESMDFSGTADDLGQFDEENPEEWFDVAAKMIGERSRE